jgi:hypothetical protein
VDCVNFFIATYFQGHKLLRNDVAEGYVGGLVLSLLLGEVFFRLQVHESLVHVPWLGSAPVGYCFESPVHVTRTSGDESSC